MSSWGDAKIFFCILFITCCCTAIKPQSAQFDGLKSAMTVGQIVIDCCLSVGNQTIDQKAIVDYQRQFNGQGCSLDAMVLVTRRDIKLCVLADEQWVRNVVKHVEARKKRCKKNPKGRGCNGKKRVK